MSREVHVPFCERLLGKFLRPTHHQAPDYMVYKAGRHTNTTNGYKIMIDDQTKTMALMEKLNAELPIPAIPGKQLIRGLRDSGVVIIPNQALQIISVVYLGDDGGIGCEIKWSENQESAAITSITHILVNPRHPLAKEIGVYQDKRIKKLSKIR